MFDKNLNYKTAILFLLVFSIFNPLSAHAETLVNDLQVTNDSIHPYIYELVQVEDINDLNFVAMSNNENITEKFRNQIMTTNSNLGLNASLISEIMNDYNITFVNKSSMENTKSSYETTSVIIRYAFHEKRREDYVYDEYYQKPTKVEYLATARWQVHTDNNNRVTYAGSANIRAEAANPYNTDGFGSSYTYSVMNNGYTSKVVIRFTIKTGFSDSQVFWYKISKPLMDEFYYHSVGR